MPIVLAICAALFLLSACAQFFTCRFAKKRGWRFFPPALCAVVTGVVLSSRIAGWGETGREMPVETLILIPGLPAVLAFSGLYLGWRLWKRRWGPRVIDEKRRTR